MNTDALPKVVMAIIVVVVAVILSRYLPTKSDPEKKRREDLAVLARKLKLQFNPKSDLEFPEKYSFLCWLKRGKIDYAYNIFRGNQSGHPVTIFDFTFEAGNCSYYWSTYLLEMKTNFPGLVISHESRESRFAEALGESHIAFESEEFSRAFRVRSADKKFAFGVCHPQMMEFLLANQDLTIEIRGPAVAVLFEDWLRPEKVEANLSRLIEIRKLLPQYLFTNA
jgi:hypothetical protein